jgi:NAD(P)-dependent dehydrogenase (short-subunit alcohol dehydrogenase family)
MQANSPTSKLSGKIALVTGGTSGIGLATTKKFVAEGAYVFITGRRRANLDEAVKTIGQTNVTAITGDVGNLSDLDVLFEAIRTKKGRLDILFANAGGGTLSSRPCRTQQRRRRSLLPMRCSSFPIFLQSEFLDGLKGATPSPVSCRKSYLISKTFDFKMLNCSLVRIQIGRLPNTRSTW